VFTDSPLVTLFTPLRGVGGDVGVVVLLISARYIFMDETQLEGHCVSLGSNAEASHLTRWRAVPVVWKGEKKIEKVNKNSAERRRRIILWKKRAEVFDQMEGVVYGSSEKHRRKTFEKKEREMRVGKCEWENASDAPVSQSKFHSPSFTAQVSQPKFHPP
jgi:hypothetical protein